MSSKKTLAQRFKAARQARGLTQNQLAILANYRQQTITSIENGGTRNPRNLKEFAKLLHTTEQYLRFGNHLVEKTNLIDYTTIPHVTEIDILNILNTRKQNYANNCRT